MCPQIIPEKCKIIAVTGTNGKTSITHFIAHALKMAGFNPAVIGTLGNGLIEHIIPGKYTTPPPAELQKLLQDFREKKADFITLEASSHGLAQNRMQGLEIFCGIFTNLTRDHLDYHKDMKNYEESKFKLFEEFKPQHAIINIDDPIGQKWAEKIACLKTSVENKNADIYLTDLKINQNTIVASVHTPWGKGILETTLLGKFNLSNLLAVIGALGILNIPLKNILDYVSQLKNIPGRMEMFGGKNNKPLVVIDYAHTPDALEKTLTALRAHCEGHVWCVFGCGGDRDKGKRPHMGRIAELLADHVILTDDNPRTEEPLRIIADIREGLSDKESVIIEHDRKRAIKHALQSARPNDMVLIAGKGHETYQEIGKERFPFSDAVEVKMLLME